MHRGRLAVDGDIDQAGERAAQLRRRVARRARLRRHRYWELGRLILNRQRGEGWGTKVIDRLSSDLRAEFPEMRGLSPRNLVYMRIFAAAWPDAAITPQAVAQLPWGHIRELLDKLDDCRSANGTPAPQSSMAGHATCSPTRSCPSSYNLDFLTLTRDAAEWDLERALVAQIERILLELGAGFAFVGRQYRLDLDGDEFFIDLLMFNTDHNRFVVIELKTTKIAPADIGQLNFYVAAVDGEIARPHHAPTVGLLLCATRNERTVRYALSRSTSPMAVAGYRYSEMT